MIVAVIGHLVLDEIHTLDGAVHESIGGIGFPLAAFSAMVSQGDTIRPVFPLGTDAVLPFREQFTESASLHLAGTYTVPDPNTRVRLYHESLAQYNTRIVASLESIPPAKLTPLVTGADLVYINMMTGDDVLPAAIDAIRAVTTGQIFLDAHMISYAIGHDGVRSPTAVPEWKSWTQSLDILQCNEQECAHFIPGYASEEERAQALFSESPVHTLLVTKAEAGAAVYLRNGELLHIDAVPQPRPIDPTGCGDVFGSVFAYLYTLKNDVRHAASMAAHAASFVAGIPGSLGISALRNHLDTIR